MEENLGDYFSLPPMTEQEAFGQNPLVLAFIGDGVFDLFIRSLLLRTQRKVNQYHRRASKIVCAPSQAEYAAILEGQFTEREADVFRRGRNTNQKTMAKNASVIDYRNATGFEALIGYLYLSRQEERLRFYFDEIERLLTDES